MNQVVRLIGVICMVLVTGCNTGGSLQGYFVSHQEDKDFIAVDIPSSLLDMDTVDLPKEEQEALESIKKVYFLAMPLNETTQKRYVAEKAIIHEILSTDTYETLMSFGANGTKGVLKYKGNGDVIDEVIIFGSDNKKGLVLVRVLGDHMNPEHIAYLAKSIEKGSIDLKAFEQITSVFGAVD